MLAFFADWRSLHSNVHLSKTIGAGVVDQVERLEGGVSGVRPDVAPVVLVNPVMEVSQVDDLKSNGLTSPLDRDWSGQD